jgi:hypothetical protein
VQMEHVHLDNKKENLYGEDGRKNFGSR